MANHDAVSIDDADDGAILSFQEDQRIKLGKAPAWAHHLHDCQHQTSREVQRLRHKAANREMVVDAIFAAQDKKLDQIIVLLGQEADDGEGGKGLIGAVLRNRKRIESLEADRNKFWGAVAAIAAAGALMVAGFRAWVLGIIHTGGK